MSAVWHFEKVEENKQLQSNSFKCEFCGFKFVLKILLENHIKRAHKPMKAKSGATEKSKISIVDRKEKEVAKNTSPIIETLGSSLIWKIKCKICDESFENKQMADIHKETVHKLNLPYKCTILNIQ